MNKPIELSVTSDDVAALCRYVRRHISAMTDCSVPLTAEMCAVVRVIDALDLAERLVILAHADAD